MGGRGSGGYREQKRTLVEQCTGISVRDIEASLRGWPVQLSCEVEGRPVTVSVRMTHTRSVFGKGRQWWFHCPSCYRRCSWLYLPPGALKFACRRCWGLAYYSQRTRRRQWLRHEMQRLRAAPS